MTWKVTDICDEGWREGEHGKKKKEKQPGKGPKDFERKQPGKGR